MTGFNKPNFKKASQLASEMLITTSVISSFPFEMKKFIKENFDITLCSFKNAEKHNIDIRAFGSESAIWQEYDGMNIIFYNQKELPARIRFSIAHELGHYLMGHITNLSKDTELYKIQELEANTFAAQLLMPYQLLDICIYRGIRVSEDFISNFFGTSQEASVKRKQTMEKIAFYDWRKHDEYDDIIIVRYGYLVDQYFPKKTIFYDFEDEYELQKERDSWYSRRN